LGKHRLIAIDLAKNVFQVCGINRHLKVNINKSLRRCGLIEFMSQQPPTEVAIEACYSSHYWTRRFERAGHSVRLLPAQFVTPFVRGNKSDRYHALALAEASQWPNIRPTDIR
jgi:transposase